MMTENGGIFVCKTRHLALAGGVKQSTGSLGYVPMSPRISSPAHPSGGGGGGQQGMGRGGRNRRDTELIGQTVRIIQGPFKGRVSLSMMSFLDHLY